MQTIQIIALGKCKESYLREACKEYEKRLSRFCQLQVTELEPVSLPQNPSEKEIAAALEKEGAERHDVSPPAGTGNAAGTNLPELSDLIRHQVS